MYRREEKGVDLLGLPLKHLSVSEDYTDQVKSGSFTRLFSFFLIGKANTAWSRIFLTS